MSTHERHVLRILRLAREPITAAEIATLMNEEFGRKTRPYTEAEVAGFLQCLKGKVVEHPDSTYTLPRDSAS
jgi:hypothetical protein